MSGYCLNLWYNVDARQQGQTTHTRAYTRKGSAMYLIISKRGANTYFRSDRSIQFVSGFVGVSTSKLLLRLEVTPVIQVTVRDNIHTIVDVPKCDLLYSPECIIVSNKDLTPNLPVESGL